MIKINKSPILTSNNYGINFFEIDENVIKSDISKIETVTISNADVIEQNEIVEYPQNQIGKEFSKQSRDNSNFSKEFVIESDLQKPLVLDFDLKTNLVSTIVLKVKQNVFANTVLKFVSNETVYQNCTLKVVLEEDSNLELSVLENLQNNTNCFLSIETINDTKSQLKLSVFDFGSQVAVQNIHVNLKGNFSKAEINSVYFGKYENRQSLNYLCDVYGKHCDINMDVMGVLKDTASKNFVGTIDFKEGSKNSKGSESEFCMLLSKTAKAKSTPILLCKEEDVDGKHSSSVGNINQNQLFYLMSRGLTKKEATKLLVSGKLNMFINKIDNDDLRAEIIKLVDRSFDDEEK